MGLCLSYISYTTASNRYFLTSDIAPSRIPVLVPVGPEKKLTDFGPLIINITKGWKLINCAQLRSRVPVFWFSKNYAEIPKSY